MMRRSSPPPSPRRQRGIALITAVLIVALATILAVNVAFKGVLDQRRSANLFGLDQAYEIALGAEALAAEGLRRDAQDSQTDHLGEAWARPVVLPIDDGIGTVQGQLEDLQGRFNLNNLIFPDGTTNPAAVKQFERILSMAGVEPDWATTMADWIDDDVDPGFPNGAEDTTYTGQNPPHLAANMPVTRISEIMQLPGFTADRYARLKPYIAALPVGTKLNVCTAPGIVLDALSENERQFSLNPDYLTEQRKAVGCFPKMTDLQATLGQAEYDKVKNSLAETSSYFGATVWVTIGTTEFTLYSLLARGGTGPVRPVLRSFGTA
ncbi:MAG TPA: type II secretion system minor pseudopilin GspK [Steroidobacteraceae bacterium]